MKTNHRNPGQHHPAVDPAASGATHCAPRGLRALIAAAAMAVSVSAASAQTIIYVDANAAPGGNGTSWASALRTLQEGLAGAAIVAPQPSEIWVAQGTYRTTSNTTPIVFPSNGAVKMYGGFVSGAFNLTDRNPDAHPTIITGDINGDTSLFGTGNSDDAAEVMVVSAAQSGSLIDGFTFNYARTRLMRIDSGSQLRVSNCTFEGVFPAAGVDAQGIIISGSSTAPKFVRNIVRFVIGGDVLTSGTFGANGSNGSNGNVGNPGGAGGDGQNGINGGPASSGGFATGILATAGATPTIFANRINSIRGGLGGDGGGGSNGGRGGDGGTGIVSGAAGGRGGNGGNGGNGGAAGAGGDAVAIAYNTTASSPAIAMNLIYDIRAGSGGIPGNAGQGGQGGNGGNGGSSTTTGGPGGNAGNGGNGGIGGAGGAAGKAVFISTSLTSTTRNITNNTLSQATPANPRAGASGGVAGLAGTAGLGGSGVSPGPNGSAGVNGSTGANGAAGTLPVVNGLLLNGTGNVSALNNIIDLPSVPTGTVTIATSTGPTVTVDHSLLSTTTVQGAVTLGQRALTGSPNFYNPEGQDGILGTDDDDFSIQTPSLALDAGSNAGIPTDAVDDDADSDTAEAAPFDLVRNPRRSDVSSVADTGTGTAPIVDIGAIEADTVPPGIASFYADPQPIQSSPALFGVEFDRPVTGVVAQDFLPSTTGNIGNTSVEVSGSGTSYTIFVGFTGDSGSVSLDLQDSDNIVSQSGVPLNGVGAGLINGPTVTVSNGGGGTPPTISDFFISGSNFAEPNTTRAFGIQFSENVEGFDQTDIQITTGSLSGASITNFFSNGSASYTIEVNTGTPSGNPTGTIILRLTDNDSIVSSLSGLPLDGTGTGQVFDSPPLTVALPTDCNNNGTPDAIDIANGNAQDCNNNNIPDSCDIAGFQLDQSFGPTPYLSRADSPFNLAGLGTTAYLEDFEDGALNTPGVSADTSSICGCGGLNDSVDGDDGTIDGSGANGKALFGGNGTTGITFNFNTAAFGRLPQFAGVVWTDGGFGSTFSFEAFDGLGQSIGTFSTGSGDFQNAGTTAEDRFFGIVHAAGVGSIRVRNVTGGGGIEVDHLQYGLIAGTPDINNNGIPDSCEIGPGSNYYADNSWRSNPNQPLTGWNTNAIFDDSDNAGWSAASITDQAPPPFINTVWSSPGTTGGTGKAYLRKTIRLLATPSVAVLRASADDDIIVTVNGVIVANDSNGVSGPEQTVDVTSFLLPGENLIAVEATDTFCCGRGAQVSLQLTGGDPDCNGNGIADNLDIFNGTATDANTNGVPDACEDVGGTVRPFPFDLARAVNLPAFGADPLQYQLHTADINSDGLVDYITSGVTGPRLSVRGGPGELMFFNQSPASPVPVTDTVAADFNRDGKVDLISSAASGGNSLITFRNVGGTTFTQNVAGGSVTSPIRRLAVIEASNDGAPDLIGLRADGQVQLFINTGAQGDPIAFQVLTVDVPKFTNTNNTFDLDVADFNHDGKQDFVMVYGGLAVMQNNGDATFDAAINFNNAYSSAVFADLSGDGFRAVVAGLFDGGGTIIDPFDFTRSLGSFAGARPLDIVAGDIDGDGNEDFAVLDSAGAVSWHRQEFLGSIVSRTVFRAAGSFNAITLADADPDGDLDLALVSVTLSASRTPTEAHTTDHPAADREGTAARSAQSIPNVRIVPNRRLHRQADMYGTAGIANSGDAPNAAVVADMNRDGRDDLVTACFFDDTISWSTLDYEGPTSWTRTNIINSAATPRPDGPASIAAADFDGDGDTDVVAAGIINGVVMWFENTSNGAAFTPHMIDAAAPGASCVAVADIDGNGRIDIAAGLATSGSIRVYRNFSAAGVPNFIKETPIASGAASVRSIALGDLDRDGLIDIVAAAYGANQLRLYPQSIFNPRPGNDGQGTAGTTTGGGDRGFLSLDFDPPINIAQSTPTCVTLADLNNDGQLDIACSSFIDGNVKVRLSQGPFEYTSVVTAMTNLEGCAWVHAADVDDDGLIDLAATGRNNRGFDRAKNLGNGTQWGISSLFAFLEAPTVCVSGDFDDDGKTDLAAGTFNNDRFIWSANYGEALYAYMGSSASAISEGSTARIADIYASNLANPGDPSISFTLFSGSFYDRGYVYNGPPQVLLSPAQVNALISKIDVYADSNADGAFSFSDALIGTLSGPFTFDTFGNLNFPLSASSEANQLPPAANRFYFVVVTAKPGASAATPNTFSLNLDISGNTFTDTTFAEPVQNRYGGTYQTGTVTVGPDFRPNCPSDLNFNGRTDTADLVIFLGRFGTDTLPFSGGDLTGDGRVNTPDLVKFLAKFGTGCN